MTHDIMGEYIRRDVWVKEINEVFRKHGIDTRVIYPEVKKYYVDYPNPYQAAVRIASEWHLGTI